VVATKPSGVHQVAAATTTTSAMLPPNALEYVAVSGGDKIAVIRGATATDICITQIV
jgi:hypothetical protein